MVAPERVNLPQVSGAKVEERLTKPPDSPTGSSVASSHRAPIVNPLHQHLTATRVKNAYVNEGDEPFICFLTGLPTSLPGQVHHAHLVPHSEVRWSKLVRLLASPASCAS